MAAARPRARSRLALRACLWEGQSRRVAQQQRQQQQQQQQ
jgi:hypothetical protein